METILNYISGHPLISWNGIEKQLQLNRNTLKQGKSITKHLEQIKELLNNYGLNGSCKIQPEIKEKLQNTTIEVVECNKPTTQPITNDIRGKCLGKFKIDSRGLYNTVMGQRIIPKSIQPDKYYSVYEVE